MIDLTIIVPSLARLSNYIDTSTMKNAEKECLTSLSETVPDEIDIIVASNGGDMFPLPLPIAMDRRPIRRIHLWEQGQCKAVNAAAAMVDTEWIMVSNNDMVYPPGWLERLTGEAFGIEPNWECVSPKLVEPKAGAPTFIVQPFGGAGGDFKKDEFLAWVEEYYKEVEGFAYNPGFNLPFLITKELWDKVGGYDINYDPWGSNGDSDLLYKIDLAGVQPKQAEQAVVYHFSQTSGTFHPSKQEYWNRNFAYFEEKWGFPRTDEGIWEATFEIPYDKLKFRPKWANLDAPKTASGG